jgi:hypothetical protein
MIRHCWACGVEKDMAKPEHPPEELRERLVNKPIGPLFIIDCDGPVRLPEGARGEAMARLLNHAVESYVVVVCMPCFYRLDVDMWISDDCWRRVEAKVPFEQLPLYEDGRRGEDASNWPDLIVELGLLGGEAAAP